MRQRPKPVKSKAKVPVAPTSAKNQSSRVRDLEKRLAESLEREKATGRALTEALEQQTATAEVLSIISASPTDLQPVLDAVVKSAARFCSTDNATIFQVDGDTLCVVAHHGPIPVDVGLRVPCGRGTVSGRTVLERRAFHVTDLQAEAAEFPEGSANARRFGHRTTLSVPLLREGRAIGAIQLRRPEADRFTNKQVALLETFADQAVIAIENVRLFNETKEALEQQTATSEILRVISSSPTDVQPVFETIAEHAMRLCEGAVGNVCRFDGELVHLAATTNVDPDGVTAIKGAFPMPLGPQSAATRTVLTRTLVHILDILDDPEYGITQQSLASGFRSVLAVPMLRDGSPLGSIVVGRPRPGPFSVKQIELLQTFADQAVIAIENVRLFKELQTSNRELTTALDKQTATSEILRVISQSQTDVQPVFAAIVASAIRLMGAQAGVLTLVNGDHLELAALKTKDGEGEATVRVAFPLSLQTEGAHANAIRDRTPVNIADAQRSLSTRMRQPVLEFSE
jgi:two-component system NtrC family sensor kinase